MHNVLPLLEANSVVLCNLDDKIDGIRIYALDDNNKLSDMLPPHFSTVGAMGTEPKSLDEALCGPNRNKWQAALNYKISQLEKLSTWVIEDLPQGAPVIPCTTVLKEKHGPDGEIESYCVRIITGGHRQVEGVNYTETFSAAAKMLSVQVILANAAECNWEIHHVDIKSAEYVLDSSKGEAVYRWW